MVRCNSSHASLSVDDAREVERYCQAKEYIDKEIVRLTPRNGTPERKVATALGFNRQLGNPQAEYPSIQIAGTSGKGSVAYCLSLILHAAGYSTGMHISPYLQVATEKSWVDGEYASGWEFSEACNAIREVTERHRFDLDGPASVHGMASLALSYEIFRRRRIDVCVMETGLGGRFDLVQGLQRDLAVITDIGLDHTRALGEDRVSIAWHKAGIMAGAKRAVAVYDPEVWPVFVAESRSCGVPLRPIYPDEVVQLAPLDDGWLAHGALTNLGSFEIAVPASWAGFPRRNLAVALVALDSLVELGYRIEPEHCQAVTSSFFPGRMERVQESPRVTLDGAHNGQKMRALWNSLRPTGAPLVLLFGVTGMRKVEELLGAAGVAPHAIVLSRPDLYGKEVSNPEELVPVARSFSPRVVVESDAGNAVRAALELAAEVQGEVVVTGSLYLVGEARNHWYPWERVLLNRRSVWG